MEANAQDFMEPFYEVKGDSVEGSPEALLQDASVYVFIDFDIKILWIWSGGKSKLFNRYIASNWVGKHKLKKNFVGFKHELIKQGFEPAEFKQLVLQIVAKNKKYILPEYFSDARRDRSPNEQFNGVVLSSIGETTESSETRTKVIASNEMNQVYQILHEINEFQAHIRFLCDQIDRKTHVLESMLKK